MALDRDPNHVFRDFVTAGVPSSGNWNPRKPEIRQLLMEWWQTLIALVGDAGGLELPNLLISMAVTGGDENNIIAEANLPVPSGPGVALFSIVTEEENTGPVTINDKPLLSNTGNELVAGALAPDGIYLFLDNGESYRLLSDQATSAIVAAAEAAAVVASAAAEEAVGAAERAETAAASVESPVSYVPQLLTAAQRTQARANIGRNNYVTPQDFGAVGDGVADDTSALGAALASGRPLSWGGAENTYRITDTLSVTAPRHVSWLSEGAKIVLDAPSSVQRAIYISLNGHAMDTYGPLFLDCQDKSFTGIDIRNSNVLKVDVSLFGFRVKNCYRASTSMVTGDGIYVRGNLNKVHISDAVVENIHMAAGAGDPLNQGVTGIAVVRDDTWGDANLIIIDDFSISGVYSGDPAYKFDQDGIRAFTAYNSGGAIPSEGVVFISNGRFENCHGRAVKSQSEHTSVSDLMIVRNSKFHGGGYMGNFEIDLQVSGGMVRNINCHYSSNFPTRVIQATLRSTEERLNATVVTVDNIIINQFGSGTGIERIVSSTSNYQTNALINMSGIAVLGAKSPQYSLYLSPGDVRTSYLVNITGLLSRSSVCHVYRAGAIASPCFVTGMSIRTIGASAPFAQSEVSGSFITSLVGANSGVS